MTEEIKQEKECKCLCHSKGFRDFLKIALGSFVGVFFGLTLFAALHKPPMPPCPYGMMRPPVHHGMHFKKCPIKDFQNFRIEKRGFEKQIPVRVEVEQGK